MEDASVYTTKWITSHRMNFSKGAIVLIWLPLFDLVHVDKTIAFDINNVEVSLSRLSMNNYFKTLFLEKQFFPEAYNLNEVEIYDMFLHTTVD